MAELRTEHPFLTIIAAIKEQGEEKNGSILQSLTVYACFMGKWDP